MAPLFFTDEYIKMVAAQREVAEIWGQIHVQAFAVSFISFIGTYMWEVQIRMRRTGPNSCELNSLVRQVQQCCIQKCVA